jgi:beta-mannanase
MHLHSAITTPLSLLISLSILTGWFLSDFQINIAIEAARVAATRITSMAVDKVEMMPSTTTPDIATNWFSGSTGSMSSQLPAAQARNDDKNKHIAQGRILGESYGNDGDL